MEKILCMMAKSMHFSSSKDKYSLMVSMRYFGVIEDIWVINYTILRVLYFEC